MKSSNHVLGGLGTTIFTVMSALAQEHQAVLLLPRRTSSHSQSTPAHHAWGLQSQLLHEGHLHTFHLRAVSNLEPYGICLTGPPAITLRHHSAMSPPCIGGSLQCRAGTPPWSTWVRSIDLHTRE
jgi:hypothetical protein